MINQVLMAVMAAGAVLGGADRLLGNKFGLGEQFERGFMLLGPLALSMAGMVCLALLLLLGLWKIPDAMVKGFCLFAEGIKIVITVGLVLAAVESLTGWSLVHGMAPISEALAVVASIAWEPAHSGAAVPEIGTALCQAERQIRAHASESHRYAGQPGHAFTRSFHVSGHGRPGQGGDWGLPGQWRQSTGRSFGVCDQHRAGAAPRADHCEAGRSAGGSGAGADINAKDLKQGL